MKKKDDLKKCPYCELLFRKHICFWCGFKEWLNCLLDNHIYKAMVGDAHIDYICQRKGCNHVKTIHYHSYGYGDIKPVDDNCQLYDSELRRTGKYFNS